MPHSSGGGSHGGGSHGGSHHSSHSGSSSRGIRRSYYPGSRRYRYNYRGQTHYIYSNRDPAKMAWSPLRLLMLLFYVPFVFALSIPIKEAVQQNKAFKDTTTAPIVIEDKADMLGSTAKLEKALEEFQDKTNITPAVISMEYDKLQNTDLESYAMNEYLGRFPGDEMHWLIAYTADPEDPIDFYFEGVQGDYTDPILTDSVTNQFNYQLYNKLEDSSAANPADTIAEQFSELTPTLSKPSVSAMLKNMAPILFAVAFIVLHASIMVFAGIGSAKKYRNAVLDDDGQGAAAGSTTGFSAFTVCGSCRKQYSSSESNCPFCGFPNPNKWSNGTANTSARASDSAVTCTSCGSMYPRTEPKCTICGAANPTAGIPNSTVYTASGFTAAPQSSYTPQQNTSGSYDSSTHGMMPDAFASGTKICASCGAQYSAGEGKCPICGGR